MTVMTAAEEPLRDPETEAEIAIYRAAAQRLSTRVYLMSDVRRIVAEGKRESEPQD